MPEPATAPRTEDPPLPLRPAGLVDIPELVRLEAVCFDDDRITRRRFRQLLNGGHTECLVVEREGGLAGYALVLFHRGTPLARLYSIATDPAWRGRGLARRLLAAVEASAATRDCAFLRLEVRPDNSSAIALYRQLGFREFGVFQDYYADHSAALRMEKRLQPAARPDPSRVPYYPQSLDFTCGPATLMMAMKAVDPTLELDRALEIRLWREATTVFMTSGHGGCGPRGLALAAHRRGYGVELYLSSSGPLFLDSVRSEEKKEVIRLVHQVFEAELAAAGIEVQVGRLSVEDLAERFSAGGIPIVLVSSYRIYRERFPHWVVVTGFDDRFVYVHDSYVDKEEGKTGTDCVHLPIPRREFARMARYGRAQLQAVLILSGRK